MESNENGMEMESSKPSVHSISISFPFQFHFIPFHSISCEVMTVNKDNARKCSDNGGGGEMELKWKWHGMEMEMEME